MKVCNYRDMCGDKDCVHFHPHECSDVWPNHCNLVDRDTTCIDNPTLILGDCSSVLESLVDEYAGRVSLIVTSPPYYVGRGYESYLDSWDEYWEVLQDFVYFSSLLLEPGGKLAINFADRYANSKIFGRPMEIAYLPKYESIMEDLPMVLWTRIIWDKVRVMIDGARHTTNKTRFTGDMRVAPNWEYIFVWRKDSKGITNKELDMTYDEWHEWVNGIWRFSSVPKNETLSSTKLAIFPEELPYRLIKMYSSVGGIILDPFMGSATVPKVAAKLNRTGIGIELDEETFKYAKGQIEND